MTRERYHALVEQLTASATADPAGYRRKVALFAALGYAYLALLLGLVVVLVWAGVWILFHAPLNAGVIKILLILGVFAGTLAISILRGLFTRIPEPEGVRLNRSDAPALFAEVDAISRELGVKPVSRIYLDSDFNAAAVQRPLFGLFGPVRNWLVLGLPLLDALSRDELRSVIAHEFGHFGGKHGSFSGWIYRQRQAWGRLLDATGGGSSILDVLITPFVKWYAPRLNAWTFVLVRAQEFEADAAGARASGPEVAGRALVKASVFGRLCGEVGWKRIFARAAAEPAPPADAFAQLRNVLIAGPEPALGVRWLGVALQTHTTLDDTHPCLRERLAALRVPQVGEEVPLVPAISATAELLGDAAEPLRARTQAEWSARLAPLWHLRHVELQGCRERLEELEAKPEPLSPEEALERANILLELGREEDAEAALRDLAERSALPPAIRAQTLFTLGAMRLGHEEEAGVALLEQAMEADPACVAGALETLRAFYERNGRSAEARALYTRLDGEDRQLQAAGQERSQVTNKDQLEPHDLPAEKVAALVAQLVGEPRIQRVWLARKQVAHYSTLPLYLLVVDASGTWLDSSKEKLAQQIASTTRFDGETFVFVGKSEPKKLLQRIRDDPAALIFDRAPGA